MGTKKDKERVSLSEFKKKLEECEKSRAEYLAGWQRARADFLNYKKEETERISDFLKYGKEEFILKLLPVLDSFERALPNFMEQNLGGQAQVQKDPVIEGFLQIKEQLKDFLKNQGVEEIEAEGKKFDPNFHEAVEQIEQEGTESGTVIEILEKGYTLHGKVIRPAKVRIAK